MSDLLKQFQNKRPWESNGNSSIVKYPLPSIMLTSTDINSLQLNLIDLQQKGAIKPRIIHFKYHQNKVQALYYQFFKTARLSFNGSSYILLLGSLVALLLFLGGWLEIEVGVWVYLTLQAYVNVLRLLRLSIVNWQCFWYWWHLGFMFLSYSILEFFIRDLADSKMLHFFLILEIKIEFLKFVLKLCN